MKKLAKSLSVVLALMLTMVLTQAAFVQAFAATADEQSTIEAETTVTEEVLASEEATEAEATTATEPVEEAQEEETAELDTYESLLPMGAELIELPEKVFTAPLDEDAVNNPDHEWTDEDINNSVARNMKNALIRLYYDAAHEDYTDICFDEPTSYVANQAFYDAEAKGLKIKITVTDLGDFQAKVEFLGSYAVITANHTTEEPTDPPAPPVEKRELKGIEVTKLPDKVFTAPLAEDAVNNPDHEWTDEDINNSVARNMQGAVLTFNYYNGDSQEVILSEPEFVIGNTVAYNGPNYMIFYVYDLGNYRAQIVCEDYDPFITTEFTAKNVDNITDEDKNNNNDGQKDDTAKADTANAANTEQKAADTATSDTAATAAGNGVVATGSATVSVVLLSVLALAGCAMFIISRKKIFK